LERDNLWLRRAYSRRRVLGGIGAGAAGLAIVGCTSTTETPTAAPAATARPAGSAVAAPTTGAAQPTKQPKYGGTFKVTQGSADQANLDPHLINSNALSVAGPGMCWSQLLVFKHGPGVRLNYEPVGDLAESWTQPDDVTYIFKIRQGVKWHNMPPVNGRELVADDIAYSFQRIIDGKANASYMAGVTKIEAPDKSILRMTLDRPNADFLWNIASPYCKVVAKEAVDLKGDLKEGPMIGTGAWIFDHWDKGQATYMKRNPDYYIKGRPYLDSFIWYRIGDQASLLNAFRSKNLDVIGPGYTPKEMDDLKKQLVDIEVNAVPGASRFEVTLKGDRPPFNDPRLREAFSKAINRQEFIDTLLGGAGQTDSGLTVASPDYALPVDDVKRLLPFDLEGAKQLMRQAGVDRIDVQMEVGNFLSGLVAQCGELIQAQLAKANINIKLNILEGATWVTQVRNAGQYQTSLGLQAGPQPTSTELLNRHHSKGPQFTTAIADPELDRMIEQQATLVKDAAARAKLVQDIQRRYIGLRGFVPLATQQSILGNWTYVKDWNLAAVNTAVDYLHVWFDK
jgi:peptide/nickel transport system substrate-binding protein